MIGKRSILVGLALTGAGCIAKDLGTDDATVGTSTDDLEKADCEVAIIGGGPGGTHTAYKLTTLHLVKGPVCLFEKGDHLGGRVGNNYDVGFAKQAYENGGVAVRSSGQVGVGGYRMYSTQYTYKLGQELAALGKPGQLGFIAQSDFSKLAAVANRHHEPTLPAENYFSYNSDGVARAFQPLYHSPVTDDDVWTTLICGPQVPRDASGYPDYTKMGSVIPGLGHKTAFEYLQWVTTNVISPKYGHQIAQYVFDVWRFRADFKGDVDAVSYMDYNARDYAGGGVYYPVPSYKPYFDIMQEGIEKAGGRIHFHEKVVSVDRQGPRYVLATSHEGKGAHEVRHVTANTVIIATHHSALQADDPNVPSGGMTGAVIKAITSQLAYKYVYGANSIQVAHQFGDGAHPNSGWWHGDISYPAGPTLLGPQLGAGDAPLRRSTNNIGILGSKLPGCKSASCDFSGTSFYNNTNELPLTEYHDFINVSRTMYNDDSDAVEKWQALYDAGEALGHGGGNAAVDAQLVKSLRLMYPKVFTGDPKKEPRILATQIAIHKPAWYYLKAGAFAKGFTNQSLFEWSLAPLAGERVYLVGDSWRNDVSGWSDAAYKSSVHVLNRHFGAAIDPVETAPIQCADDGSIIFP